MTLEVSPFHDPRSGTVSYVVTDLETATCAIIDSVLGFDPTTGATDTPPLDPVIEHVRSRAPKCAWILEKGHDYGDDGRRPAAWETTAHQQRAENRHARDGMTEEEFVSLRTARDRTLAPPKLFEHALRFNLGSFAGSQGA